MKNRIVKGINNDSTRARLYRQEDLSLERCIEIYKAAEAADKHMKTLTDQTSMSEDIDAVSRSGTPPPEINTH